MILVRTDYQSVLDPKQKRFLKKIIYRLSVSNLMTLNNERIEEVVRDIGKTPNPNKKITLSFRDKKNSSDPSKNIVFFKDLLIWKFNYGVYRGDFYPKLFRKLGIRACVYCNSQLTLNVEKNTYNTTGKLNGIAKVAKYELDHAYSKSDYPYLSATVFNLYPSCGVCNNIKRKKEVKFKLYSSIESPSIYKFSLKKESLVEYMTSYNSDELIITFEDPDKPFEDKEGKGSLEDTFHISSIYNAQKDIAEEIIIRSHIYNDTYRDDLHKSFSSLFPGNAFEMERIFLGTYPNPQDIHLRPLSKFIQDISADVKRLSIELE
jgi:hypothetical protein